MSSALETVSSTLLSNLTLSRKARDSLVDHLSALHTTLRASEQHRQSLLDSEKRLVTALEGLVKSARAGNVDSSMQALLLQFADIALAQRPGPLPASTTVVLDVVPQKDSEDGTGEGEQGSLLDPPNTGATQTSTAAGA